jgi:hypothetical protein
MKKLEGNFHDNNHHKHRAEETLGWSKDCGVNWGAGPSRLTATGVPVQRVLV